MNETVKQKKLKRKSWKTVICKYTCKGLYSAKNYGGTVNLN